MEKSQDPQKKIKQFKNLSIFLKISILFEAVMIITVVFVTLFITTQFTNIVCEKEIALGETRIEKLANYALEKYNRIYSLSNYIHSGGISDILADIAENPSAAYEYSNIHAMDVFFSGISSADNDISDIIIMTKDGTLFSHTSESLSEVQPSYDFKTNKVMEDFLQSEAALSIQCMDPSVYTIKEREKVVAFLGKIYDSRRYPKKVQVGTFIMNVPLKAFLEASEWGTESNKGELSLVNGDQKILFSTNDKILGKHADFVNKAESADWYFAEQEIGTSEMKAVYLLSKSVLLQEIYHMQYVIIVVLIISIAFTSLAGYLVARVYRKRIKVLMDFMAQVEEGNLTARVDVDSQDEIGILSKSFNEMCEKLDLHIDLVYKAKLAQKNAELNALQMQINPHFLYNTLESIKARALEENDEITAEMIVLLSDLFRWSARTKDKIVSLEEEMDYINTYLKLQSYRYRESLEIDFQIPEECLELAIPKLILQPIVENVIHHAFGEKKTSGIVGATVKIKENNRLEITIYDNGEGMSPERLQEIRERLDCASSQDEFESIGIQNVHYRLTLLFGGDYGLTIASIENSGTAVKVSIPAMTLEEMSEIV